ncbi:MAG: tetratricopeptide repeat-containing sensor histidine kinase [Bacteroidota bacterium]
MLSTKGFYPQSIALLLQALEINEKYHRSISRNNNFINLGVLYLKIDQDSVALNYFVQAENLIHKTEYPSEERTSILSALYLNKGSVYAKNKRLSEAGYYIEKSMNLARKIGDNNKIALSLAKLAEIKFQEGNYHQASSYIEQSRTYQKKMNNEIGVNNSEIILGEIWHELGRYNESIAIGKKCLKKAQENLWLDDVKRSSALISQNYKELTSYDSAYKYQSLFVQSKDSLFNQEKNKAIASLQITYDLQKKVAENQLLLIENKNQRITLILLAIMSLFAVAFSYFFLKGRTKEKRSRHLLHLKSKQIEEQNVELVKIIDNLKKAQSQLIHAEKMASLGMLTAGIAHEINNPINFISGGVQALEANLRELRESHLNSKASNTLFIDIDDLMNSIKNGVSRTTDIISGLKLFANPDNKVDIADLRISLDSTLAILNSKLKNKTKIIKDYQNVRPIKCHPGQINQVFLNVIDNAIQAIDDAGVEGVIQLKTYEENEYAVISIKDNGPGIPDRIRSHIFDPFFSTKEVGKGTGLGLSISYNIINEHHGKLEVISEFGKGAEFIIKLPLNV